MQAATRVAADDRTRLEQLCRYVIRPPVAAQRLRFMDRGLGLIIVRPATLP